ncbi:hypothetical protein RclHR1_01740007 [Rhizophagus clarus]|uniref:Uncharacterized protein n=1 Tax=Rhizophagus clarus TaxID=94130 RepID=A0A2Z6QK03_9GLOM|nr:hypothetical protein RclHR1_01740007 [Rhizophagus clarus]
MPLNSQLNINITLELQKDMITKTIIPALFKILDIKAYLISENVLYEMIHQCHCYQREDLLNKNKAKHERTKEIRRKHVNSHRSKKRSRQENMITHLQLLDNPVILKLKKSEFNPIVIKNVYHSSEESEVDPDGDSNETCIIIQDIEWRRDCINK